MLLSILIMLILSTILFVICYCSTGTDEKNLKSLSCYPDVVQKRVEEIPEYRGKFHIGSVPAVFLENLVLFLIVLFLAGLFVRTQDFGRNVLLLSIIGQGFNAIDLFIIDLLWWRNTERIRLSKIPDKAMYQNPRKHVDAFLRGVVMFLMVAVADGYILTLF